MQCTTNNCYATWQCFQRCAIMMGSKYCVPVCTVDNVPSLLPANASCLQTACMSSREIVQYLVDLSHA